MLIFLKNIYQYSTLYRLKAILFAIFFYCFPQTSVKGLMNKKNNTGAAIALCQFLKNEEYFNPIVSGKTLFGYHLQSSFFFCPQPDLQITLGIWALRSLGEKKYLQKILPICTTDYRRKHFRLLFGHLLNNLFQPFIAPLFDQEQYLTHCMEGLYIQYLHADFFLHWRQCLHKKHKQPEKFLAGIKYTWPYFRGDTHQRAFPLQGYVYHVGGQGIQYKGYSLFIGALGHRWTYHMHHRLFKKMVWDFWYVKNFFNTNKVSTLQQGHGLYSCLMLITLGGDWIAKYWQGYNFCTANIGEKVYQSSIILQKTDGDFFQYITARRHLLFLSYRKTWRWGENFTIQLALHPYYDFTYQIFEQAAELLLSIKIFITK